MISNECTCGGQPPGMKNLVTLGVSIAGHAMNCPAYNKPNKSMKQPNPIQTKACNCTYKNNLHNWDCPCAPFEQPIQACKHFCHHNYEAGDDLSPYCDHCTPQQSGERTQCEYCGNFAQADNWEHRAHCFFGEKDARFAIGFIRKTLASDRASLLAKVEKIIYSSRNEVEVREAFTQLKENQD